MRDTFRPENECADCGYTWHPRGKNRSLKCPSCNQANVLEVQPANTAHAGVSGALILVLVLVLFLLYSYFTSPNPIPTKVTTEESSIETPAGGFEIGTDSPIQSLENETDTHLNPLDETTELITSNQTSDDQLKFREAFYDWSRSEIQLRDKYTKLLNDPDSSAAELERRKVEYLSLAEEKNKKCGDLNNKLSSNLNSDVSHVRFEAIEIDIINCHTQENFRVLEKTDSSVVDKAIESEVL